MSVGEQDPDLILLGQLDRSVSRIRRLLRSNLCKALLGHRLVFKFFETSDGRAEMVFDDYDEESVDAFVLNFRLLIQNTDKISTGEICDAVERNESLKREIPNIVSQVKSSREAYQEFLKCPEFEHNRESFTNDSIARTIIFGALSHENPEKAARLNMWLKADNNAVVQAKFLAILKRIIGHLIIFEDLFESCRSILNVSEFTRRHPPAEFTKKKGSDEDS